MASSTVNADDYPSNENQGYNSEDISAKAQEFLNSDEIALITDPKLKREKQKLNELLESYKKLIDKLDKKFENNTVKAEHEKKLRKIPEIFAILHPELYKNTREEEKKKLIGKFSSKRLFLETDKIVAPIYRTPPESISDARQEEKERLIKILSSSPARFLNSYDPPVSTKKIKRSKSYSLPPDSFRNQREAEKERLIKILATSSSHYRKSLDANRKTTIGRNNIDNDIKKLDKQLKALSIQKCSVNGVSVPSASTDEEIVNLNAYDGDMVRVGEYSPLISKEKSRILFGYGEHEERRNQLLAERRKEYGHYLSNNLKEAQEKVDKALSTEDNEPEEINNEQKKSRSHSISTQTEDLSVDFVDRREEVNPDEATFKNTNNGMQTSPWQHFHYLSPREKLMSDLHGVSRCFPGANAANDKSLDTEDVKFRQAAYARALQQQIEEKRRLEEERKRKEREEDEIIEQRIRLQQEKMQSEVSSELKKKQDWIAQRQSQEEILRRKMIEMKLEAQELKKLQSRKKRLSESTPEMKDVPVGKPQTSLSEPSHSRDFIKPQATFSDHSHGRNMTGRVSLRSVPNKTYQPPHWKADNLGRFQRLPEYKFNPIEKAPLLDADRQNILSGGSGQSFHTPKANPRTMKNAAYNAESRSRDSEKAEELLRAPLDFRIDSPLSPPKATDLRCDRPPSPPIPALRTRDIINNNTKVLEDKWKIPGQGRELNRTQANEDNILTQLGAFRRQLQQEHMKLEARLQKQASP